MSAEERGGNPAADHGRTARRRLAALFRGRPGAIAVDRNLPYPRVRRPATAGGVALPHRPGPATAAAVASVVAARPDWTRVRRVPGVAARAGGGQAPVVHRLPNRRRAPRLVPCRRPRRDPGGRAAGIGHFAGRPLAVGTSDLATVFSRGRGLAPGLGAVAPPRPCSRLSCLR